MKDYDYNFDSKMGYEGTYREKEEREDGIKQERPMLDNVISILQALINILDIIGDNLGKRN